MQMVSVLALNKLELKEISMPRWWKIRPGRSMIGSDAG